MPLYLISSRVSAWRLRRQPDIASVTPIKDIENEIERLLTSSETNYSIAPFELRRLLTLLRRLQSPNS